MNKTKRVQRRYFFAFKFDGICYHSALPHNFVLALIAPAVESAEIQKLSDVVFQLQRDVNVNEERWANLMQQQNEQHRAQANLIQQQNEQHRANMEMLRLMNEELLQQNEQHRAYMEVLRLMKEELLKYGPRKFLFFDKLCDESEMVRNCYTQQLIDFAQVFQIDSDVESMSREHLGIRRHLRIRSHRYSAFIMLALIFITASQFTSLLITTRSKSYVNVFITGELAAMHKPYNTFPSEENSVRIQPYKTLS
ncbi:hypothetical protein LguiB_012624 [Lonicera macranthoides]